MDTGPSYTKSQMRQLRRLADLAYDRELSTALNELEAEFARWHAGEIVPLELSDLIHRFHDGIARDLWKEHTHVRPPQIVARAVATAVLAESDVGPALMPLLKMSIEFYRWEASIEAASEDEDLEDE